MKKRIVLLLYILAPLLAVFSASGSSEAFNLELVGELPYQQVGTLAVSVFFVDNGTAQVALSLLPTNFGTINQSVLTIEGKKGETKTVQTEINVDQLGWFQIVGLMQIGSRMYNNQLTVKMTENGGTPIPPNTPLPVNPSPLEPNIELNNFDLSSPVAPAGSISISGTFNYFDRNGIAQPAEYIYVELMDKDFSGSDDQLGTSVTGTLGEFYFPAIPNFDFDEEGPLDVYIIFSTELRVAGSVIDITDTDNNTYSKFTVVNSDIGDGTYNWAFELPQGDVTQGAAWLFNETVSMWWLVSTATGHAIGDITARWSPNIDSYQLCGRTSCFDPHLVGGVFVSALNLISSDVVRHEIAHAFMYNERDGRFWYDISNPTVWISCVFQPKSPWQETTTLCAQTEGFADWTAVMTDRDPSDNCYDLLVGRPCSGQDGFHWNLENNNRNNSEPLGSNVEGRVATTLFDLVDLEQDGLENSSHFYFEVWDLAIQNDSILDLLAYWPEDMSTFYWNGILEIHQVYLPLVRR